MVESETSSVRTILEVIGITLLALLVSLLLGVVFVISLGALGYDVDTTFSLAGATVIGQVGFLLLAFVYTRRREVTVPFHLPSRSDLKYVFVGLLMALITVIIFSQLLLLFDLMPDSVIEEMAETSPNILIVLAILSVVLIAPAEELLFRGAIQGRLRQRFGPIPAITGASLLFGSLHLFNYSGDLLSILISSSLIVVIGGIMGGLYERTNNLAVPIVVHGIYNFILLLPSYFSVV